MVLTAAVRDLHLTYPGQFLTDVRTPCPHLWENNPHITPLDEKDAEVEVFDCHYPLIHKSNRSPGTSWRGSPIFSAENWEIGRAHV